LKKGMLIAGIAAAIVVIGGGGLWFYHGQPQFCGSTCHIMKPYLVTWNGSDTLARAHAEADVDCLDCHEQSIGQQIESGIKFVTNDYETPLEPRQFPKDWCLRCHEHGTYAELIERTKYYMVEDERVNPHDYPVDPGALAPEVYMVDPEAPDPHDTEVGELECYQCHKVHGESPGIESCYPCHHDAIFTGCVIGDCHADVNVEAQTNG
jgi:cytochrome c nitrite reductase small subunit